VRGEDEEERRGVVVDHHRRLGAADPGDAPGEGREALPAAAGRDVVLEGEV
jgi:hypothetical protein